MHFQKATNWSNYLPLRRKVKIIAAFSCYLLQGPLKCGQLQHDWFCWYFLTLQHIFTSRYEACNYKTCLHVLHLLQQIKREVIPDDFFVLWYQKMDERKKFVERKPNSYPNNKGPRVPRVRSSPLYSARPWKTQKAETQQLMWRCELIHIIKSPKLKHI